MSRHAASLGWTPALRLSLRQATNAPASSAPTLLSSPASPARVCYRTQRLTIPANACWRNQYGQAEAPNAVFAHTPSGWPRPSGAPAAQLGLRRALHHTPVRISPVSNILRERQLDRRRWYSDKKLPEGNQTAETEGVQKTNGQSQGSISPENSRPNTVHGADGSGRHLSSYLPHLHRPTKEELLAAATGFWNRLGIRFKWFSIRSSRPYKIDDLHAFFAWIFWGHVLWIIIGTTTFASLAILAVNSIFAQETLAGWVGNYLTQSSGIKVVFESAIVPKWKDGVIEFKNVFVSRRPGHDLQERSVSKGSRETAAAAAALAAASGKANQEQVDMEDDGNYTQFDVNIESVAVTLSFAKWFNGKGLLRDVEIHGVRGVIDRTHVHWSGEPIDPKSYRHEHVTGDFEIDDFKMEDVLLTLCQPNGFRPFTVSVFNCELPRLRKQWLFYDFMAANNMSGSFDDSLFTIHPRQVHNTTGTLLNNGMELDGAESHWKKQTHLRIDGLNIDHLNRGVEGPFGWIHEGKVDIVADVMIPSDDSGSIVKVMSDFYDQLEATVTSAHLHGQHKQSESSAIDNSDMEICESGSATQPQSSVTERIGERADDKRFVVMDIRCQLNDVRATVPLFTKDLSYVNNALVRPIVAYINSRRAFIPVNCRVVKRQSEFDGSWTIFDSGLLDDLSRETYDAFSHDIYDQKARTRRMKKVGLWTLQVVGQALFLGLAGQLA